MSGVAWTATLQLQDLPGARARLGRRVRDQVLGVALLVEREAKARAPVRTGFLRNSITTQLVGTTAAEVRVGAAYGVYVEFGTRRMAARPFLWPAALAVAADLSRRGA